MSSNFDPDEPHGLVSHDPAVSWAIEIEFDGPERSIFRSARSVILDGESVQVQTVDGGYEVFPIGSIRKILSMRAISPQSYTDEELSADEIY
ncbi:MAG: hypothetical protein AB7L09_03315 [Nitrospira sp.]